MDLAYSLRQTLRTLGRRPGFTLMAVSLVALGIAANTVVWSVIDAVLIDPVPYEEPGRLIDVLAANRERGIEGMALTRADYLTLRDESRSFEAMGAYVPFGSVDLTDTRGELDPVSLPRHLVSAGLLRALRIRPALGRIFGDEVSAGGADARVALLSNKLWQERFASDPEIVGGSILLDGEAHTVIGVLPEGFRLPGGSPRLLLPLVFEVGAGTDRDSAILGGIARLAPGTSLNAARSELELIGQRLEQQFPDTNRGLRPVAMPLEQLFVRTSRVALWTLAGAVSLLLLIVCVNVAHLQLVRAVDREQELAVRVALGATTSRLVRQLMTENALLSAAGGGLGALLAMAAIELLPKPQGVYLPADLAISLDARAFGITALLVLVVALVQSLVPAARLRRIDPERALRLGQGTGAEHARLQGLFVIAQTAMASMLLIVFGLLLRSFLGLQSQDLGFEPEGVVVVSVNLPETRYPTPDSAVSFLERLEVELEGVGGVKVVGAANELPPSGGWGFRPKIEGESDDAALSADWKIVTPGYFAAVATPIVGGRGFLHADRPGTERVMVVNEAFARMLLGGEPMDRRVRFNDAWWRVIGVAADQPPPGAEEPRPAVFLSHLQEPVPVSFLRGMSMAVRVEGRRTEAVMPEIRAVLADLDPLLPATNLETFETRLGRLTAFSQPRFASVYLGTFATLALVLAAVGLYAVLSHMVTSRRRDLAIHLTQGADCRDLQRLVLGRGLRLTVVGLVLGALGALALSKVMGSLLVGVAATDPLTFVSACAVLLATATAACLWPALRASRVQPTEALRG